jgi:hypothetical protein
VARKRKQSFKIDRDKVANFVVSRLEQDRNERRDWLNRRVSRYAKFRGWLPERNGPWPNSSNFWVPVMTTPALRAQATIFNAATGNRPIMQARAFQSRNVAKQKKIDQILDWQLFVEQDGASKIDDMASNFVYDGTVFSFIRWVKDKQQVNDVRILDKLPEEMADSDPTDIMGEKLLELFGDSLVDATSTNKDGYSWKITIEQSGEKRDGRVDFYDRDDGRVEAHIQHEVLVKDGPVLIVEDIEDIVAPLRSANLQPPGPDNPFGAPYVNRIGTASLDEIRRRMNDGTYDLMTEEDWIAISTSTSTIATDKENEQMREQKDAMSGFQAEQAKHDQTQKELRGIEIVEHYGLWDVNGDGLDEHVIFWVARDTKRLLRARYLTEIYPGTPIERPIAEARFISVPNQLYGIGLLELVEPLYDIYKNLMDMNIDWGEIRNIPYFFYRSSSSMQPEIVRLSPGDGFPLDNPQQDVMFPRWGNENNAWVLNTMGLVQQMIERLSMISDVQLGRIPTGKASALRTMGTTMALLQQGDVRSEQLLRRFFVGLKQVHRMFHRLNKANFPEEKEIRVTGLPKPGDDYLLVTNKELDADMDFEFRATLLNTNRQMMSQVFEQMMGVLISPLALQMGLTDQQTAHQLIRDYVKSLDQDPDQYLKPPTEEDRLPRITGEQAISTIVQGDVPDGAPLEGASEHLKKLMAFQQSDDFGLLDTKEEVNIYTAYLRSVMRRAQEEMQQQQMVQAAQQMQQQLGGAGGQAVEGGVPTTVSAPEQQAPTEGAEISPEAGVGQEGGLQ